MPDADLGYDLEYVRKVCLGLKEHVLQKGIMSASQKIDGSPKDVLTILRCIELGKLDMLINATPLNQAYEYFKNYKARLKKRVSFYSLSKDEQDEIRRRTPPLDAPIGQLVETFLWLKDRFGITSPEERIIIMEATHRVSAILENAVLIRRLRKIPKQENGAKKGKSL